MSNMVYLIDDEPDQLDLLGEVVALVGLRSNRYTRGRTFFDQVGRCEPGSILVLDLHLPGMDGIQVMRQLAQMENPPALILISGHDAGVLHAAEKLGRAHKLEILASLNKPVLLERFQQLLLHYTASRRRPATHRPFQPPSRFSPDELSAAIQAGELLLHYQPQVELETRRVVGVEALVRWQHPLLGLVYPDRFIPLAEQSGLIDALTTYVINRAVEQNREWAEAGFVCTTAVNISADNITGLKLPEQLWALLRNNQLDPTRLSLEVTESALMGELVTSLEILTRLRLKGFSLSIDDFGTGYSSLSLLHRVPFSELKIDRGFVMNLAEDEEARAIVKTCIMLGHELGMQVVAEGVEEQSAWDILQRLNCDRVQGYFIARPMAAEDIPPWVSEWERLTLAAC